VVTRRERDKRQFSKYTRPSFSEARKQTVWHAPKALLHFICRMYSRYAIITRYTLARPWIVPCARIHRRYLRTSVSSLLFERAIDFMPFRSDPRDYVTSRLRNGIIRNTWSRFAR